MDDFFGGVMIMVIFSVVVFTSCSAGKVSVSSSIKEDCDNFSRMSIDSNVYQCKFIKNNPK